MQRFALRWSDPAPVIVPPGGFIHNVFSPRFNVNPGQSVKFIAGSWGLITDVTGPGTVLDCLSLFLNDSTNARVSLLTSVVSGSANPGQSGVSSRVTTDQLISTLDYVGVQGGSLVGCRLELAVDGRNLAAVNHTIHTEACVLVEISN